MSLRDFETGAGKVEKSLNRLADSFSGRKIIQDANLTAEAIQRIGGASQLTENEQRRVNALVTEALAKYKALGVEAPQHMRALAEATKSVADNTAKMERPAAAAGNSFKQLFGAFTAANLASNAISFLTNEVKAFVDTGLRLPAIETAFKRLNSTVGQSSDEMLRSLQSATQGLVSNFDLMQSSNKALLLGLPVTQESMGELARAATALGRAMGMDATKSLDDLITALGRSSPMILDNLGLSVKLGEANEIFAQKLGKTASQLTDAERKMAFYEAAMEAARKKTAELGEQSKTLGEVLQTVWTSFGNNVSEATGLVNVGLGRILSSFKNFKQAMEEAARTGGGVAGAIAAGAAQERAEQLDREMRQAIQRMVPKGHFVIPVMPTVDPVDLERVTKELTEPSEKAKKAAEAHAQAIKALRNDLFGKNQIQAAKDLVQALGKQVNVMELTEDAQKRINEVTGQAIEIYERQGRVAPAAMRDLFVATMRVPPVIQGLTGDVKKLGIQIAVGGEEFGDWLTEMRASIPVVTGLGREFNHLGTSAGAANDEVKKISRGLEDNERHARQAGAAYRFWGDAVSGLVRQLGSVVGGDTGNIISGIGDAVGQFGQLRGAAKEAQEQQKAGIDSTAATIAAISAGAGAMYAVWKTVIAITEKMEFNAGNAREQFFRATGVLRDMNLQLRLAGVNTTELFNIKDQRSFDAAFAQAQVRVEKMNRAMQDFGLTWRDFTSLTQEFVTQAGRDLIEQFDHFIAIGGDAEKILGGMSRSMSQLVVDAVKTGSKIPAALRPMLEQLIRTKKLSEEAAAALLGITTDAVPAFQDIEAAANRYGIEIDALGSSIQQIKINELAAQIVRDFELITNAGGDVNAVLKGMADDVQDVVDKALTLGISLPSNMKPILQAMIDAGLLTDQFGNKLLNLNGIHFETPLVDKISELIDAIKELIDETDRFGINAVHQFGRARNAAESLGKAIPRGFAASTGRPTPDTTTPPTDDNRAVPRPGTDVADAATESTAGFADELDSLMDTAAQVGDALPGTFTPFISSAEASELAAMAIRDALRDVAQVDFGRPVGGDLDYMAERARIVLKLLEEMGIKLDAFADVKWPVKTPSDRWVDPDEPRMRAFETPDDSLTLEHTAQPTVVNNYNINVENANGSVDETFANNLITTFSGGRTYTRFRSVLVR